MDTKKKIPPSEGFHYMGVDITLEKRVDIVTGKEVQSKDIIKSTGYIEEGRSSQLGKKPSISPDLITDFNKVLQKGLF